jgi:putative ABC transport system permease protein
VVTIALAIYAMVAVIVSLVIGAGERARALSFLRTLGLSDRQAQRLTILEIFPMILVTALVGLGLGLGLPAALGPGVDLSSYAGDIPVGDYSLDLITPAALAAGLAAVAVLGAYAHTAISRRRSLGAVLRVGDS